MSETTKKRVGPMEFLRQVRAEAKKVTWASRNETVAATIMVVIMMLLASGFFFLVDQILGRLVRWITGTG